MKTCDGKKHAANTRTKASTVTATFLLARIWNHTLYNKDPNHRILTEFEFDISPNLNFGKCIEAKANTAAKKLCIQIKASGTSRPNSLLYYIMPRFVPSWSTAVNSGMALLHIAMMQIWSLRTKNNNRRRMTNTPMSFQHQLNVAFVVFL